MKTIVTTPRLLHPLLTMLAIAIAPSTAYAMDIGDVSTWSILGEPLDATVEVRLDKGEKLDDSCLSLSAVDQGAAGKTVLLPTKLTVNFNQVAHCVEIKSHKPFNEPYALLHLQIKCQGAAVVSRTLTIMPEPKLTVQKPKSISGKKPLATTAQEKVSVVHDTALPAASNKPALPPLIKQANAEVSTPIPDKSSSPVQDTGAQPNDQTRNRIESSAAENKLQPKLRLFVEQLDLSRIGKLSAGDVEWILAQQKLLGVDDQTAHYQAMLRQMKSMQEELDATRHKLTELESSPKKIAISPTTTATPAVRDYGQLWRYILLVLGVMVTALSVVFGMRYFAKLKKQPAQKFIPKEITHTLPTIEQGTRTTKIFHPPNAKQVSQTEVAKLTSAVQPEKPSVTDQMEREEHAVLEEAELYAVYGHADKGIRILQEFVSQRPQSERAWMLLLSIYSSCGKVSEFESSSRSFRQKNINSSLWKTVQALGRTLDKNNPLYVAEKNSGDDAWLPSSQSMHRPIGTILIELGYLSVQDLENCMGEFDPKKHGRFGNYLLTRRMINHAQLNEALLKQQSSSGAGLESYGLPTLQQMEDLLKDFNPQRDGSVEEYLKERKSKFPDNDDTLILDTAPNIALWAEKNDIEKLHDKTAPLDFSLAPVPLHEKTAPLDIPLDLFPDMPFEPRQVDAAVDDKTINPEVDKEPLDASVYDKTQDGPDTHVTLRSNQNERNDQ